MMPDDNDYTPLAYIAQVLQNRDATERGTIAPQWHQTPPDVRKEYLQLAYRLVDNWRVDEQQGVFCQLTGK